MKVDGYSYERFCRGIVELDGPGCWLARLLQVRRAAHSLDYSPGLLECQGEFDGHHVLSKQRIKDEWKDRMRKHGEAFDLAAALNDPRNGVIACRQHHDRVERHLIVLRRRELPPRVFEFAGEYGLLPWLERYYVDLEA